MKTPLILIALAITVGGDIFAQSTPWVQIQAPDTLVTWEVAATPSGALLARSRYSFNSEPRLFRSTNNGDSWSRITSDTLVANQICSSLLVAPNGVAYASFTWHGVAMSLDNGLTWTLVGNRTNIDRLVFDRFSGALLAIVGPDLYRSIDSAKTWVSAGAAQNYLTPDGYGNLLGVNLSNVMYRSTNGGQSWFESNSGLTSGTVQYLAADSAGRLFAATSGAGLYRSTSSGNTWSSVNNGLIGSSVTSVIRGVGDMLFCGVSGTGVFRSTDHGDNWMAINSGLTNLQVIGLFPGISGSLIAATSGGKMYRTTQPLTSVELDEIPQTFVLDQNVPNPFNPTTTISFVLPSPSMVSLTVVDMQGRVVATLANQAFVAGRHVRTFDAADLSSGIYFCRLIAVPESNSRQAISLARKMVLLR